MFGTSKISSIVNTSSCDIKTPGHVPLDVENYPVAPDNLALEQVHVYVRHGERTPVKPRMTEHIPPQWQICHVARQFKAAVAGPGVRETLEVKRIVERKDGTFDYGECTNAELTDFGRKSTYNFGNALRKLYVDRLHFLPDVMENTDEVYLRSSNRTRTIESLQQVIHGLFPLDKQSQLFVPHICVRLVSIVRPHQSNGLTNTSRNKRDENLYPNTSACPRLNTLMEEFAKAAADSMNPTLEPLDQKISKYIDGKPIRIDGSPKASGILETIRAATANGVKVPKEFLDPAVMDPIEKAVVVEWFGGYAVSPELRRLGVGRVMDDVSQKMQRKALKKNEDQLKILVNCTHDTTIAGVLQTFGVYDRKWPAFTAQMTFELYKDKSDTSPPQSESILIFGVALTSLFSVDVRMRYQNDTVVLPACAAPGNHLEGRPEFCTLKAFAETIKEFTPTDWEAECTK
ncbi:phosphoglycerate mutase-like protein [Thelephora ganbajun]|uniref:Phosphoglycerate mutase-like protein n=1 Tax=Thelephora ganbajun TaxID=370292 RepID=A0ACB6ZJK1_THEGA|nr:phosphoglycerate mutase-like protein [Thelephora ganbajun]